MAAKELKNSIQMGHFANLAATAAQIADGSGENVIVGYVIGKANGVSYRANPNGDEPSIGITGQFEAIPTEEGRAPMVAPMIFLPNAFTKILVQEMLTADDMKGAPKKAPAKGKPINLPASVEIPLALEIGIRKNKGEGAGYEFSVTTRTEQGQEDAFADLRALLPDDMAKRTAPALPAPGAATKRLAAPKKKRK